MARRQLLGIVLCTFALGIVIGDGIARAAGWDGPVTGQLVAAVIVFIGAALMFAESLARRSHSAPHA